MSTETTAGNERGQATTTGPAIRVFEPALCCNSGVCGTDPVQALVDFTANLAYLQSRGVDISRHNLATDPRAFVNDAIASDFIRVAGSAGLPLVVVDGVTVAAGAYPDRARLEALAGLSHEEASAPEPGSRKELGLSASSGSCCGGPCC